MNTYNYNPYNDDLYHVYPKAVSGYRQTTLPNQSYPPQENNQEEEEASYAESILNLNKGKRIKVYMSFSDSLEWRDRIFEGTLESWGRDFILLKERENKWYMLSNIYISFIEFNETVAF